MKKKRDDEIKRVSGFDRQGGHKKDLQV